MAKLEIRNLSKKIERKIILSDISLSIEEGETVLIAGLNGSGKSMLLKLIKGLEKESDGSILIDGRECGRKERMRKVALVFQDAALEIVGESVREDIAFGLENQGKERHEIESETERYLNIFALTELAKENPRVLSGGEKRKVAIAAVLAMGPDIILLDEPLSSLDYPSTILVIKTLIQLKEMGKTVILVSHEAEKLLAHMDRTIILKEGKVVSDRDSRASIEELRRNDIYVPSSISFEDLTWLR